MPSPLVASDPRLAIFTVRHHKVIVDSDLAALYSVTTKRLNEQMRRNQDRFPEDFAFQLSAEEWEVLRSQIATSKSGSGGRRYRPFVFTEHGALMAANLLNSPQAVRMSVEVVRAFVRLRQMALSVEELSRKVRSLENKYDGQFKTVFDALRQLLTPPEPVRKKIGFHGG
jgi:ORF6N domain